MGVWIPDGRKQLGIPSRKSRKTGRCVLVGVKAVKLVVHQFWVKDMGSNGSWSLFLMDYGAFS